MRKIIFDDANKGVKTPSSYELRVAENQDPFVSIAGNLDFQKMQKMDDFFKKMNRTRESFGHRYTTHVAGTRISAGAEHVVDATMLATRLKYYIELDPGSLYERINKESNTLDIWNKEQLINYLSLIKAWSICSDERRPITFTMAQQFRAIIENDKILRRVTFDGSRQFITDLLYCF